MKIHTANIILLFSILIIGCEDASVNQMSAQKPTTIQEQVTIKSNKQAVLPKQMPPKAKKQEDKIYLENKLVASKSENAADLEPIEPVQYPQTLDLTVPSEYQEIINIEPTPANSKQALLPDLFAEGQEQEINSVQIDGKVIKKEEQQKGKSSSPDGIGINIKLSP